MLLYLKFIDCIGLLIGVNKKTNITRTKTKSYVLQYDAYKNDLITDWGVSHQFLPEPPNRPSSPPVGYC